MSERQDGYNPDGLPPDPDDEDMVVSPDELADERIRAQVGNAAQSDEEPAYETEPDENADEVLETDEGGGSADDAGREPEASGISRFNYEEREYQTKAVKQILEALRTHDSAMLESPVGSGKTVMGLMVIKQLQEQAAERGEHLRVIWVAARHHILRQTRYMNESYFKCPMQYVSAFNSHPPRADLMVIDEAHHEATQSVLNMYENSGNRITLGLSATPMRTDRMKLSFQVTVRSATILSLIRQGYLVPYHSYKLSEWSPAHVADIYLADRERFGKSLAFFHTIEECAQFQILMRRAGVNCELVTGQSNKEKQIDAFMANRVQVITNVSVLTEGFDVPDLNSVFIRDGSRVPTIQMAGRGLRTCPGKTFCNLIQSQNTAYPVERIASPAQSFRRVNGTWRSLSGDTEKILKAIRLCRQRMTAMEAARHRNGTSMFNSSGRFDNSATFKVSIDGLPDPDFEWPDDEEIERMTARGEKA